MAKKQNNQETLQENLNEKEESFDLNESIDLDQLSNDDIDLSKEKLEIPLVKIEEDNQPVLDIRRVPNKRGNNPKHTIKSGSDLNVKKNQIEEVVKTETIKTDNTLIKRNNINVIKSKKDQYVPDLIGKKYKIYFNGKMIYDSTTKGVIKFNPDWLEIGTTKYFYDKINFVL